MPELPTVALSRLRVAARAPRAAVLTTCGVLTLTGLAKTFAPVGAQPAVAPELGGWTDLTQEEGIAERFAFDYLSLEPSREDARDQRLRVMGLADTAAAPDHLGRRLLTPGSVVTVATRVVTGGVDVTVAIKAESAWWYLSVPVRRTPSGLSVGGPPAIVGPPRVAVGALGRPEDEVPDAALQQVAGRFVRHYLANDRVDLAADLLPRAAVSPPSTDLRVASVESVTWARAPRVVAAVVRARGRYGLTLTLRYELTVVRRGGRWLVAAVAGNPNNEEQRR